MDRCGESRAAVPCLADTRRSSLEVSGDTWALKWSITLGTVLTLVALSPLSAFVVVIMGGSLTALMVLMERLGCPVPDMFGAP